MTPQQISIVQDTFALAAPRADELSHVFYDTLFRDNPGVADMFPADLGVQRKKLVAALAAIVTNITDEELFMARVTNLGKRHIWYGAEAAHYDAVGAALLKTLAQLFGPAFTGEVRAAWAAAYAAISTVMQTAAAEIRPLLVMPADEPEPVAESDPEPEPVAEPDPEPAPVSRAQVVKESVPPTHVVGSDAGQPAGPGGGSVLGR